MVPEISYAKSGDVNIAYQVLGNGPFDLVFVPGFISNLEHHWSQPNLVRFMNRLSAFSRLIMFDKRGTGLSDRVGRIPTLEQRMDDVRAVMDAVGSRTATIFGMSEGGAMSALFAATYPERTRNLVLYGAIAHFLTWVVPAEKLDASISGIEAAWGTGESLKLFAPTGYADPVFKSWWARYERLSASPSAIIDLTRMNSEIDVRSILPTIRVPTLVLHRAGDGRVNVGSGRFFGSNIPKAKYVEQPGGDHLLWAIDADPVADEIEHFLTGQRASVEADRVLATVMFTDIVDSTKRASDLGDRAWRDLLSEHDKMCRDQITRFRGREIKSLGDGFLATFDGPARAVRCALALSDAMRTIGLEIKIGLHTGEIELLPDDIAGIAVHVAARIANLAAANEILTSSNLRDLVAGSGLQFDDQGHHTLKGIADDVRIYVARP